MKFLDPRFSYPIKIEKKLSNGSKAYSVRLQSHKDHLDFKCVAEYEADRLVNLFNFGVSEVVLNRR